MPLQLTPDQEELLRQYLAQNPGALGAASAPRPPQAPSPAPYVGGVGPGTMAAPAAAPAAPAMPMMARMADDGFGGEGFQKWGRAAGARSQGASLGDSFMAGMGKGSMAKKSGGGAADTMESATKALEKASKFASL